MKTTEIKNEGGASVKYDIVNIGCKDCPYCMMAEGHYLCRSDKSCNAKANMTSHPSWVCGLKPFVGLS